jgi:uncharacterized protein with LGFP repeats
MNFTPQERTLKIGIKRILTEWLGDYTSGIIQLSDGAYANFKKGAIYFCDLYGTAFEMNEDILKKYRELNLEKGLLGYPKSDGKKCNDGVGIISRFENGIIIWHPDTGAHEMHGNILKKYQELNLERGKLGYPISDESGIEFSKIETAKRENFYYPKPEGELTKEDMCGVKCSIFQKGIICWYPNKGAYAGFYE